MLLLTLALLGGVAWFIHLLRRRLRTYAPLSGGWRRLPLVGAVARAYTDYLWLAFGGLLRAAGADPLPALRLAAARVGLAGEGSGAGLDAMAGGSPLVGDLAVADSLGKLDDELRFQQDACADGLLTALVRFRRRSRIIVTVLTYLLVAAFVSAMYMPLLSVGQSI